MMTTTMLLLFKLEKFQLKYSSSSRVRTCVGSGIHGLVVMGGDSCSKWRGFKFQHCILAAHFCTFICYIEFTVCLKKTYINEKRPGMVDLYFVPLLS